MVTLYRAVPSEGFDPSRVHVRQATARTPMNIPYVVDNLWEAIRPDHMPSRRHAAYASPTPSLALANASSWESDRSKYIVCKVELLGPVKFAQLPVKDARDHADIRLVQKAALAALGPKVDTQTLWERSIVAPLFLPGLSAQHLYQLAAEHEVVNQVLEEVRDKSTFWDSAHGGVLPHSDGELFFELQEGATYRLVPLELKPASEPSRPRPR